MNPILQLQQSIGNQAVQRLVQAGPAERPTGVVLPALARASQAIGQWRAFSRAQSEHAHQTAQEGTSGHAGPLPHLDAIQRSFGRGRDLSAVQAHIGGPAAEATRDLGAEAYTSGEHVVFCSAPSLQTAAHEAAHVVQQRAGVRLVDSRGEAGDPYEQHADEVARQVVAGRSAEGILGRVIGGGDRPAKAQKQAVQLWGPEHKDFTARAVDRWNKKHPSGTYEHIAEHLKSWMVGCSDDPDHTGRALTGTVSDLRIYWDFVVGGKKRRWRQYAAADPAKKKEMEEAANRSVCASEGPEHGEGNRPNYGCGGAAVNQAYMLHKIAMANTLTLGSGFMSRAGAGQLGDAMHCAQDRGSHCEGNRHEGHDDVKDKLGIGGYNTDDPNKNLPGKRAADGNSDLVLAVFSHLRRRP
jgi:hypothetical protein